MSAKCQKQTLTPLFDHLVGAGDQGLRYIKSECLRSRQIDCEVKLRRLFDWQIAWLCSAENYVFALHAEGA
jgi:hypothetical protein